jgi:outer membrane protein assembly factor BamE (lipoprotein component of BamABCDE complex)
MNTKERLFRIFLVALLAGCLTACVVMGDERVSKSTPESLQQQIIRGKTTKSEVRNILGSPGSVSFTDSGNEQWNYEYLSTNTFKLWGAMLSGKDPLSGSGKSISVFFDKNGTVLNYTSME